MSFEIGELHPNTPHLFADLAELLLLVGYDGRTRLHTNDLESLLTTGAISSDELDDEEDADQAEASSADRNSRHERQIEDVMTQLSYRAATFDACYPFTMRGETLEVHGTLTERQRVYRLLLACSRLRSFGGHGIPQRWARCFTELGRTALQGLVPPHATTRVFDANSLDRDTYYGTDLREALRVMGHDLGVIQINETECDRAGPSGDAGFDLIATLNFEDGAATAYAMLGQCGAQETGWPKKTLEAHALNCHRFFQVQFEYPSVMFTPVCYRTAAGEWVDNKCANGILLTDRGRILHLVEVQQRFDEIVGTPWFTSFENEFSGYAPPD